LQTQKEAGAIGRFSVDIATRDIVMKTLISCLAIVACQFASAAFAACEMPSLVASIPDGATATEDELFQAQTAVQAYIAAMDDYIACQNEEMAASTENASAQYLYQMTDRIDSARAEVDAVASNFNDQVSAFRAARQTAANPLRTSERTNNQ
jgi:hypothetical protein